MAINTMSMEDSNKINNSKDFAKIPNDFFYNGGEILNKIGGRDSFLIYCLLTSRKNMNDDIYISIKEMINIFQFEKNVSRSKIYIIGLLLQLVENKYIDIYVDLRNININEIIQIKWIKLFPKLGGKGWIKFYADDFEIHKKVGNIPYLVMWILRMYVNHQTKTSFLSVTDMTNILRCDRNKVQNAINLFKLSGLFYVSGGEYYYNSELDMKIRRNNEYKYSGNIEVLSSMDDNKVYEILFPER